MTTNTRYFKTKEQYFAFRDAWSKAANAGVLNGSHFILYNIISGKDPAYGFTPFQRMSKIEGQGMFNVGYHNALLHLRYFISSSDYWVQQLEVFLSPFEGTFTKEDFYNLNSFGRIPELNAVWSDYGKGRKLKEAIKNGEMEPPKTCIELMEYINSDDTTEEAA